MPISSPLPPSHSSLPEPVGEWRSPFTAAVPGQLLAARLATPARHRPGPPPGGLQKITETS